MPANPPDASSIEFHTGLGLGNAGWAGYHVVAGAAIP